MPLEVDGEGSSTDTDADKCEPVQEKIQIRSIWLMLMHSAASAR